MISEVANDPLILSKSILGMTSAATEPSWSAKSQIENSDCDE